MEERIIDPAEHNSDDATELSLRPEKLIEYIGQPKTKEMLDIYIKAALNRSESLDHVLLFGPPGLGKTTLANIIANELGSNIKIISGPAIERSGDLAAVLSQLEAGDVLFIDEIHRLPRFVEEVLYSAMEDYRIDVMVGSDSQKRTISLDLEPFTLVGATTRYGDLSAPLRDRFGITCQLEYYSLEDLKFIIERTAKVFQSKIDSDAALELARRSRGTPRIANRLFRRIRDYADVKNNGVITFELCNEALSKLGIDSDGLDAKDYKYLSCLIETFNGNPVGLGAIAASISEEQATIEDVYEPYLLQEGYIKRTQRGRIATEKAYNKLGVKYFKGLFS